jgi:hypothetical protein
MCKRNVPILRAYSEIADKLPCCISRRQMVRMADIGTFPPYVRPAGERSEPCWVERDVLLWCADQYGKVMPDFVARLEKEGFAPSLHDEVL